MRDRMLAGPCKGVIGPVFVYHLQPRNLKFKALPLYPQLERKPLTASAAPERLYLVTAIASVVLLPVLARYGLIRQSSIRL